MVGSMSFPEDERLEEVSSGGSFQRGGWRGLDQSSSLTIVCFLATFLGVISIASDVSF